MEKKTNTSKIFGIFDKINSLNESFSKKNEQFIKLINEYSQKKDLRLSEYNLTKENRFCIFDNFSPKYYYEKLHSEILKTILDKNTIELRNESFLNIFLECIKLDNTLFFNNNVMVDLEYPINPNVPTEAIDILIHDDKNALIIENKINNAIDQKNQLVRYMKFVQEELNISNYYVVYLTLIPGKKPPINKYSVDFEKYTKLLSSKGKLIFLSAVENDETKNSLVNFFLPRCEERIEEMYKISETEDLLLTKLYIKQYKILLNKLGGYAAMESTNRELAKEIFSNKDCITSSFDFVDFWQNRFSSLYPIIYDEIKNELDILTKDENDKWFYLEINNNCHVYFECDGHFSIGFTANEKKWTNKELERLTKIIEDYAKKESKYFVCKNVNDNKKWTWTHNLLKEKLSIDELKTIIKKSFKELPKLVNQKNT